MSRVIGESFVFLTHSLTFTLSPFVDTDFPFFFSLLPVLLTSPFSSKDYQAKSTRDLIRTYATSSHDFLEKYYDVDPHYLQCDARSSIPPILAPPPVSNLWVNPDFFVLLTSNILLLQVINGVNVPTEVTFPRCFCFSLCLTHTLSHFVSIKSASTLLGVVLF